MSATRRGYIEQQDGTLRMRWVKEGYDADDPATPFDAVLFDSESDGMGAVLETGQATIPETGTFTAVTTGMWLRTWSYGFTPLCIFSFNAFNNAGAIMWDHSQWANIGVGNPAFMSSPRITVSASGIWLRGGFSKASGQNFLVRWVALRVAAR